MHLPRGVASEVPPQSFTGVVHDRLKDIVHDIRAERTAPIQAIETMPDHVERHVANQRNA
jgi:REP element-mobilizing transposase RayT